MPEEDTKQKRNLRKVLTATVVSDKQDKTLVVKVARRAAHPLYRKVVTFTSKCYVHDENNEAKTGDVPKSWKHAHSAKQNAGASSPSSNALSPTEEILP